MAFEEASRTAFLVSSGSPSGTPRDMKLVENGPGLMLLILTPSLANLAESYLTHVSNADFEVP